MEKKSLYLFCLFCTAWSLFASCEKYLDIDPPNNKLPAEAVFSDSLSASSAIAGIYSSITQTNGGFLATHMIWAALSSDELDFTDTELRRFQYYQNNVQPDNSYLDFIWNHPYLYIYMANSVMEGVERSATILPSAKASLIAEAKFIRAFMFFYLVNYFGDVPLTVSADYRVNERLARTPVDQVYDQIIADLEEAERVLPEEYPTPERVRPNKWAATAFLARVHLYRQHWEEAEKKATALIDLNTYRPLPAPANVFLKDSRETIWQLFPATAREANSTYDAAFYVPSSLTNTSIPLYALPDRLLTSFEDGDERKSNWIGVKTIGSTSYYFPFKYKVRTGASTAPLTEYTIAFRLSEQYLIRAEARAHRSNPEGAIDDLNELRRRAGIDDLPDDLEDGQVLQAVEDERQHELFCEWGHRWFDLKRTGRADAVIKPIKGDNWQSTDILWPVPLTQLLANPVLIQNDGY